MMTRRVLKKRSKQAVPILIEHFKYKPKDFFLAEGGDSYHGLNLRCDHLRRPGRFSPCDCQYHPLAGTPMTGEVSGYYEPEWDERTAFEQLRECIEWNERPATASDAQWSRALAVSGTRPVTAEEIGSWLAEDEAA